MLSFPSSKWTTVLARTTKRNNSSSFGSQGRSASLIIPRLYLSDYITARDDAEITRLGITHVISVLEYIPTTSSLIPPERKLHIRLADRADADIYAHFEETNQFIGSALSENDTNRVLVHCFQGISRSATIVCAYLVASKAMIATEAIAYAQKKRGIICPNIGFRRQLETYYQNVYGVDGESGDRASRWKKLRLKTNTFTFVV